MLRNYVKTAWRNLRRNKLFSFINIAGLSLGLAGCLLIGLYIFHELSYDRFQKNAARLYRVTAEYTVNGAKSEDGPIGSLTGPRLSAAFPQIESYVRILNFEPYVVQQGDRAFVEPRLLFADSTFFTMFSYPLLEGDPVRALDAPHKVVITRSMEKKYFGEGAGLGKVLKVGGTTDYVVSGIAQDPPLNSQISFDFVASFSSLPDANYPNWWVHIYHTYFLLRNPGDASVMEREIPAFMKTQPDINVSGSDYLTFHLEPFLRVHLFSRLPAQQPNGNITYLYILSGIALLILLIACVNYTNLATAQASRRVAEIGIRKVLGSGRGQLFRQFLGEALLLNALAMAGAILLFIFFLPSFDKLVERPLDAGMLLQPRAVLGVLTLYVCISLASGAYPSLFLSNLRIMHILKTGFSFTGGSGTFRKSLIVFQFAVSTFLLVSTTVIFQQLAYIQHKDLGYDKDHILVLPVDKPIRDHYQAFKEAIERLPGVLSVSCGTDEPADITWDDEVRESAGTSATPLFSKAAPTDTDFVRTMGLHLVSGSNFTESDWLQTISGPQPHTSYLLNESLARALGWTPEEAIGKTLYRSGSMGIVKGVVKDFHFTSLHEPITPLLIFLDSQYNHIYRTFVKVSGSNTSSTLKALESVWQERVPHRPFEYHFLDDTYNTLYHTERQTSRIFTTFAGLAIILACLGLFALAAYTTVQRAKEIGIRKVLGADAVQIVLLVTRDSLGQVVLASLIAFPIAWYFMNRWLQSFAYRIQISWLVFAWAALGTAAVALASIGYQAIKAARANPIESLRSE